MQEMIGVCSILTQDPSVDPVKYLNRAFEHYSKLRSRQGRMLATRVMMTAAAYQAALGRYALSFNYQLAAASYGARARRLQLVCQCVSVVQLVDQCSSWWCYKIGP